MNRHVFLVALLSTLFVGAGGATQARDRGFGLGVVIGDPTGISTKLWVSPTAALDGAIAWSLEENEDLHIHGDYLAHDFGLFDVNKGALPLYYGIGARADLDHGDNRFGVRVPLGVAYIFEGSRVDLFFEIAPIVDLTPETDFTIDGGVGVRYFFR
jgi:hypothetical protein